MLSSRYSLENLAEDDSTYSQPYNSNLVICVPVENAEAAGKYEVEGKGGKYEETLGKRRNGGGVKLQPGAVERGRGMQEAGGAGGEAA